MAEGESDPTMNGLHFETVITLHCLDISSSSVRETTTLPYRKGAQQFVLAMMTPEI